MESDAARVFIIIVNWNGWEDTLECLRSLESITYPNYSIVVVDNGSTDRSVQKISENFKEITLIESEENRGFAGGNNLGIRHALSEDADFVWLLNNDTVVDKLALEAMVTRMNKHQDMGICGSTLIYYDDQTKIQALGGGTYNKWIGLTKNIGQGEHINLNRNSHNIEKKLDYIVGASMLVSRNLLEEVGLLNEDYFLYYEEMDWAMRARDQFTLGYAADSIVYHKEGASTGGKELQRSKSKIADYFQIKNRLKFSFNYFPLQFPFVYVSMIFVIINRVKRGQWNRIPMVLKLLIFFNSNNISASPTSSENS